MNENTSTLQHLQDFEKGYAHPPLRTSRMIIITSRDDDDDEDDKDDGDGDGDLMMHT